MAFSSCKMTITPKKTWCLEYPGLFYLMVIFFLAEWLFFKKKMYKFAGF